VRPPARGAWFPGYLLWGACVAALAGALGAADAIAQPAPAPEPAPPPAAVPAAPVTPAAAVTGAVPAGTIPRGPSHGLEPLPGGEMVPLELMPPGSSASPVPSDRIFPPQTLTIRFNHRFHVKELQQTCKVCHAAAFGSSEAGDRLLPSPAQTCDNCHDVNHANLDAVQAGKDPNGQCGYCHLGERAGEGGRVAPMVFPQAHLRMSHKAHLDRNIGCAQCHGAIEELELATREQLPRMAGCFVCHAMSGAAAGKAKGHCTNCHVTEPSGRMLTSFATGELVPPAWLHGSAHTPDWIERHKGVAGANSELCANCHSDNFCTDCHDGRLRPRSVHPNDWISMHAQAARQDNPRCTSCHQLQNFCGDCHRRVGVARDAASGARPGGRRFHPPPEIWTLSPRSAQHHAFEAMRNLNACVACHSERDCATCHATKGLRGGAGVNPHPPGFVSRCGLALKRNNRPCLVCHGSSDPLLAQCD
jgi:hypothetical protein